METLFSMTGIEKSFGKVTVLRGCQLTVNKGEIHALMGENGAGKSTLMNILGGVFPKDSGKIIYEGKEMKTLTPDIAEKLGIGFVHQELNLAEDITVAENVYIARFPYKNKLLGIIDWKKLNQDTQAYLNILGATFKPTDKVVSLSTANKQLVEIAKALSLNAKVIIFDEPTTSLSNADVEVLFIVIRALRDKGISSVYISHRMAEIFELCEQITIMRDGAYISTDRVQDLTNDEIIQKLVGRSLDNLYPRDPTEIVIVSRITNPFFTSLVDAIEQEAVKNGYRLLIFQSRGKKDSELQFLEMLKNGQVDGIIMCSVENDIGLIETYRKFGIIILCNEVFDKSKLPNVALDQSYGAYLGTRYLIDQGHTHIAYCTGGDFENGAHGMARNKGFLKALDEVNLDLPIEWIFHQIHTVADGSQVADHIMHMSRKPTAVFTSGDEVASGMIATFLAHGIKVPQDIAVLGYDNQPFSNLVARPLTTINQPVQALGRETFRCFMAQLHNQPFILNSEDLTLTLVVRTSA